MPISTQSGLGTLACGRRLEPYAKLRWPPRTRAGPMAYIAKGVVSSSPHGSSAVLVSRKTKHLHY